MNSKFLQLIENAGSQDNISKINLSIAQTDLNKTFSIKNKKNEFFQRIKKYVESYKQKYNKSKDFDVDTISEEIWEKMVKQVEEAFKPSNDPVDVNEKKMWLYILSQPNQIIKLSQTTTQSGT